MILGKLWLDVNWFHNFLAYFFIRNTRAMRLNKLAKS